MEGSELADLGLPAEAGEEAAEATDGQPAGAAPAGEPPAPTAAHLARLRDILVAAHPEAIPELIGGDDLDALLASVEMARAAYARVRQAATQAALAAIPRGGGIRALDPAAHAALSPEGKIAFALAERGE